MRTYLIVDQSRPNGTMRDDTHASVRSVQEKPSVERAVWLERQDVTKQLVLIQLADFGRNGGGATLE